LVWTCGVNVLPSSLSPKFFELPLPASSSGR
jgi:hypothetical protein